MTVVIDQNVNAINDATVDFVSLPAGKTILVWGTKADAGGTGLTLPSTIERTLANLSPATVPGDNNQALVLGVDITPSSAPLSYTIGGTGGTFSTGGFKLTGIEATDINRVVDLTNHSKQDANTGASNHTATLTVPSNWTEDEGLLFFMLQANASVGAVTPIPGMTIFTNTSRVQAHRLLAAGDKNTKPSVTLTWANDVRWIAFLVLLKPAVSTPPPTNPTSPTLFTMRGVTDGIEDDADAIATDMYAIENLIDTYETEPNAGSTGLLRARYYDWRRALAELRKGASRVQSEIDSLQGTSTPPASFKIVTDTTLPFVAPTTDLVSGASFSSATWAGIRTVAGAVPNATITVDWWWDAPFTAPASLSLDRTNGPDWAFPLPLGVNGSHALNVEIETFDEQGTVTALERHSFNVSVTGAAANSAPTVNAGTDQSVAAGSIPTLTSSAIDPDGDTLVTTDAGWSQLSGPATLAPAPPSASNVWKPNCVVPGVYILEARWRDPKGATGIDQKQLTVTASGAGNNAKDRLGLFPRLDGGYPQNDENLQLLESGVYLNRRVWSVRETVSHDGWGTMIGNLTFHLSNTTGLWQLRNRSPNPIIYDLIFPLYAQSEQGGTLNRATQRAAFQRCAAGDFDSHWDDVIDLCTANGWGTSTQNLWLNILHEYDLAGTKAMPHSIQGGNVDVAVSAAIHVSQHFKAALPNIRFSCGLDNSASAYLNAQNVATNKTPEQAFEEEWAKRPGGYKAYIDAYYTDIYNSGNLTTVEAKLDRSYDAAVRMGVPFTVPEWGARVDLQSDSSNRDFVQLFFDWCNARPASGPGSLIQANYFEGWPNAGLFTNAFAPMPLTRARFLLLYGS